VSQAALRVRRHRDPLPMAQIGPSATSLDVRYWVAIEGKADMPRTLPKVRV